jgi:hypothetical protein
MLKCAGIADRFVHLSVLLQLAGLAKCERLKVRRSTALDAAMTGTSQGCNYLVAA